MFDGTLPRANLDRLTCPDPTAEDWRYRARFWARYAMDNPEHVAGDIRERMLANIRAMHDAADRLESPAPVAAAAPPKRKAPGKPKVDMIGAQEFWRQHSEAVSAVAREHGQSWANNRPECTIMVTVPARLRSYKTERGTTISFRKDWRMPAVDYWPGAVLPAGIEAVPLAPRYDGPMGDDHPGMAAWRWAIEQDRWQRKGDTCWGAPSWPPLLDGVSANEEASRMGAATEYGVDVERELAHAE